MPSVRFRGACSVVSRDDVMHERLRILYLSPLAPAPPRSGAQARMHGLLAHLARRHEITAVSLLDPGDDAMACARSLREHCREVVLVPNPKGGNGLGKRLLQLRSAASLHSFERHRCSLPALQRALDGVLSRTRFDLVNLEFPYLAHYRLAPPGAPPPPVVLDAHDIAYEIVRQVAGGGAGLGRRLYASVNWRKLRRDELAAFRRADGVYTCSAADRDHVLSDLPSAHVAVVPNAADVDFYQPRPSDPPSDGRTLVFFGLLSTFPNTDGVLHFAREIWPRIAAERPEARFKIIGDRPPPSVRALAGPRVEVAGLVEDLRPHLASAAALVVPLRLGSGTRLKVLEGMAMGKAIVSTALGARGIDAVPGRDLLVADDAAGFAAEVIRLLDDPALAARLGRAGRQLAVERYSWAAAARALEGFYAEVLAARRGREGATGEEPR
jgi:polysaccharide biosynthesis protein PslH